MTTWINFQEVKKQGDFVALLNHFDLSGKQKGDELRINCPFHDDETPSCGINLVENKFNCFGCNEHGNILDFATLLQDGDPQDSKDLRNGAKLVMEICNISTPRSPSRPRKKKVSQKPSETKKTPQSANKADSGDSEKPTNEPLKFKLTLEPESEFFDRNNISSEQVELFGMGFAGKGSMEGRIAIPIHNENNELVAYVGRWASDDDEIPEDSDKYKFPPKFKKTQVLYNLNRVIEAKPKHVVLVEGFWSVQRLHQLNIPAVACMGTSISKEQIDLLTSAGVKFVTVIFDGDEAGQNGVKEVCLSLSRFFYTRVIDLEDGIKPDTMGDDFIAKLK
jgi:DNA primase